MVSAPSVFSASHPNGFDRKLPRAQTASAGKMASTSKSGARKVTVGAAARAQLLLARAAEAQEQKEQDEQFESDLLEIVVELYRAREKMPRAKRRRIH